MKEKYRKTAVESFSVARAGWGGGRISGGGAVPVYIKRSRELYGNGIGGVAEETLDGSAFSTDLSGMSDTT